jgi:hypothetical protein
MLLPGLFAEIQRVKHVEVVEKSVEELSEYVLNMDIDDEDDGDEERGPKAGVNLWLDVAHYQTTLETWKVQLVKMIAHVDELTYSVYGEKGTHPSEDMIYQGSRIKERLMDIVADYEELQRKCEWVIDGTSLANGMASNFIPPCFSANKVSQRRGAIWLERTIKFNFDLRSLANRIVHECDQSPC